MNYIDEMDSSIIRVLQGDATVSMDELAERVNLSRNACWRRVKALQDAKVITGKVALVDPQKVGCGLQVLVMVRTNRHDADWMATFDKAVRSMLEITAALRMTGDLDYVLRVQVRDVAAYDAFYKRLTKAVAVSDISASFVMEEIKATTAMPI
ncbi:MAG: Lrp/AsnC family transcriptional regulator [Pseudomonadota bacterium]